MTRLEAPIGQREDQRTEFKRAEALRRLEPISHAVVSMLNASGGNVWIGVIEQDERWQGVEPIENADREAPSSVEPSRHDCLERDEKDELAKEGVDRQEQIPLPEGVHERQEYVGDCRQDGTEENHAARAADVRPAPDKRAG